MIFHTLDLKTLSDLFLNFSPINRGLLYFKLCRYSQINIAISKIIRNQILEKYPKNSLVPSHNSPADPGLKFHITNNFNEFPKLQQNPH